MRPATSGDGWWRYSKPRESASAAWRGNRIFQTIRSGQPAVGRTDEIGVRLQAEAVEVLARVRDTIANTIGTHPIIEARAALRVALAELENVRDRLLAGKENA